MSDKLYKLSALLIFTTVVLFPAYQLIQSGGLLYYTNGWDEASYLQYDYAKHVLEISSGGRAAQSLVILFHDLGLSGGYINLVFDLFTAIIILTLLPVVLVKAGYSKGISNNICISILGAPLLISNLNPLFDWLQSANMESVTLKYITMPYINDPFWLRTPEPQLSIILLLTSLYIALSFNNRYLVLAASLISYPFVGVPAFFTAAAYIFSDKFKFSAVKSLLAAFVLISTLLLNYRLFYLSEYLKGYIVLTNIPLLSFCGLTALIVFIVSKNKSKTALVLVTSIWLAVNFQLISGFTIQPNNFEQYWSAATLVFLSIILFKESNFVKNLPFFSLLLLAFWTVFNFNINNSYLKKLNLSESLLSDIKNDPSKVAVNDIGLSTRLDLLYPLQKPMLFSYTRFYKDFPQMFINDFLCARQKLASRQDFKDTLNAAAEMYKNGDKNYQMNTIKRVFHPPPAIDLSKTVPDCDLKIYPVSH